MKARSPETLCILSFVLLIATSVQVAAMVEPHDRRLQAKEFRHADLTIPDAARPLLELTAEAAVRSAGALAILGVAQEGARVDARGGRFETLLPARALIATRTARGQSRQQRAAEARDAFIRYLDSYRQELGVDTGELGAGKVTVHGDGSVVQIYHAAA